MTHTRNKTVCMYICIHTVLLYLLRNAHIMTFSFLRDRLTPWVPSLVSFGIPHPQPCDAPPLRPVTRPGVRGLIICTDPGLSPQGGCLGKVALNPTDMARGRRRGKKTGPGSSQSALLGRLMNVQDFMIFATQASGVRLQWVTVSRLENLPAHHHHHNHCPPSQPAHETRSPPRTRAGRPPSLHKHWRSILDCPTPPSCHHPPRPFNSWLWLRCFHPVTHTSSTTHWHRVPEHFITLLAGYGRLQYLWVTCESDTWLWWKQFVIYFSKVHKLNHNKPEY